MNIGHTDLGKALEHLGRIKHAIEAVESRERMTLEICQLTWDLCREEWELHMSSSNNPDDFLKAFPDSRRFDFDNENDKLRSTCCGSDVFMLVPRRRAMDRMAEAATAS